MANFKVWNSVNFYGIEIDDYAHETAKLSFWIAQHQMNLAFDEIIGEAKPTLPLILQKYICKML